MDSFRFDGGVLTQVAALAAAQQFSDPFAELRSKPQLQPPICASNEGTPEASRCYVATRRKSEWQQNQKICGPAARTGNLDPPPR
jgi:hypothetical protein